MLLWPWAKLEQRAVCAERCTYGSGRRGALALLTPLKITGWGWYYLSTVLDDFSRYIVACDLAEWLDQKGMQRVRGAPYHPQTQEKIERWHQTLKNRILLDHYYIPGDLERQVGALVEHYNHVHYHESIDNLSASRCLLR
ncbi:transposase InsO family protein [Bradyrhizobium ottawaense]